MKLAARILVLVFGVLLLAPPAPAQMPEVPPGKWWKRPKVIERLALSAEQQERMEEIFRKNRRAFIDLKADVERRQLDLEELLTRKGTDPRRISDATDALEQARGRLGKQRTMMIVEMKGVMNEEQWKKILDARDQVRREWWDERRGSGGPQGERPMRPNRRQGGPSPSDGGPSSAPRLGVNPGGGPG